MKRRQFLQHCSSGLCACTAASLLAPVAAAQSEAPADWRLPFVQARYSQLIALLATRLSEAELAATLQQLGRACAGGMQLLARHRDDVDGFIREFTAKSGEQITYDRTHGVITVASPERDACFCPLIDARTCPKCVCDCSLGWQQQVYETLLGRRVEVTLKESVVRGGKRCVFEIRVKAQRAT